MTVTLIRKQKQPHRCDLPRYGQHGDIVQCNVCNIYWRCTALPSDYGPIIYWFPLWWFGRWWYVKRHEK